MDVVVGLDSGTTATKAVTAGTDGRVRDLVSVGYPLSVPAPGRAELDARRLADAAVEALAAVTSAARERGDRVVGVCLSAAMHGLVPMDDDGRPLGPLITWADDRAAGFAEALRADDAALAAEEAPAESIEPLVEAFARPVHQPAHHRPAGAEGATPALAPPLQADGHEGYGPNGRGSHSSAPAVEQQMPW